MDCIPDEGLRKLHKCAASLARGMAALNNRGMLWMRRAPDVRKHPLVRNTFLVNREYSA